MTAKPGESSNIQWMYEGKNSSIDREAYLLGKRINKAPEDEGDFIVKDTTNDNLSVSVLEKLDYESKLREDPLMAIKKNESEKRYELLSNPIKRKRLQSMLKNALEKDLKLKKKHRKNSRRSSSESSSSEEERTRRKKKKKTNYSSDSSDSDDIDSNKLLKNAHKDKNLHEQLKRALQKDLKGKYKSSDSSSNEERSSKKRSKHKKADISEKHYKDERRKKHSKHKSDKSAPSKGEKLCDERKSGKKKESRRRKSSERTSESPEPPHKSGYGLIVLKEKEEKPRVTHRRRTPEPEKPRYQRKHAQGFTRKLDKDELERKRREMMQDADWREDQRRSNVSHYSKQEEMESEREEKLRAMHAMKKERDGQAKTFLHDMKLKRTDVGSLADTVRRKRHTLTRPSDA